MGSKKRSDEPAEEPRKAVESSSKTAAAKRKAAEQAAAESSSSSDSDEDDNVATQKSSKRQDEIARLKREITGMSAGGGGDAEKKKKPRSYLQERRSGYVNRGKTKAETRSAKKKEAEAMMNKLKNFQERVRDLGKEPVSDDKEKERAMKAAQTKPKAEENTLAAIWQEGDEAIDEDWLDGNGLKFHVSADKAFKMRTESEKKRLEIFDPLAASGNKDVIAEEQKKRSNTKMQPTKVKRIDPKIAHPASAKERL